MARQGSRPLILTIDDDDMTCLMLKEILSCEGFDVLTATDAQTGLDMFLEHHPNLILLDVMMPDMDGFTCLESLRAIPETRLLPIVMLTGIDDVKSIHRCFGLGATDFIAKPINWPTLPYRLNYMIRASGALKELDHNEAVLRNAQKIAHLGNWDWERCTDYITWSEEALKVLDLAPKYSYSPRLSLFKTVHPANLQRLQQALELCMKQGHAFSLEIRLVHADKTVHVAHIQGEAEMQQERVEKIHGTVQDITERRRIEDQVHHLSYYDPLTSLPNRTLFKTIFNQSIGHCARNGLCLAGLFVGIDRFKRINETLGATVGDRVLQLFTERLAHAVRNSDYIAVTRNLEKPATTVSRLGDSEFIVMLNSIRDTRDSIKVVKRIFKEMESAFEVEGNEIHLVANIGIAVYPEDGEDVDTFIKNGEFAMNHAREQGQNSHRFFSKDLHIAAFHKLSLENRLRHAIERNELVLHYQPKVNLQSNKTIGMEALVRWQHPELGLVPPDQFIPIAEESGLIVPIGAWVLDTACRQLRTWQLAGMPPLTVAVNVSAVQFRHKDFLLHIREVLDSTGLASPYLKLELTESTLMMGVHEAMAILQEIRTLGIRISIDDFGTGYSSLSYLKKLPISELKIDQSFVRDIPHDEDDNMITSAIIALAKSLSLEVVAEGVENQQQLDFLRQHDCDTVQGYFFSRPLAPEQFSQFMFKDINNQEGVT
ncbi:MAG: GGDEF and EAL domain-containing protein [Methylobacter sp.]|nr:MAG: GGDEF and EAL domain-containing protein [Methylobacter sp.]